MGIHELKDERTLDRVFMMDIITVREDGIRMMIWEAEASMRSQYSYSLIF